jgi:hypothetical protein
MQKILKRTLRTSNHLKEILEGTKVAVTFPKEYEGRMVRYTDERGISIISYAGNLTKNVGIKIPSQRQLEKWVMDSVCKSVAGKTCEPDGWDSEGFPSWLLIMGII